MLSPTVSKVLPNSREDDAAGIAKFCLMFDRIFDIMHVSCTATWWHKLKPLYRFHSLTILLFHGEKINF